MSKSFIQVCQDVIRGGITLPKGVKYLALDYDGEVVGYAHRPLCKEGLFYVDVLADIGDTLSPGGVSIVKDITPGERRLNECMWRAIRHAK